MIKLRPGWSIEPHKICRRGLADDICTAIWTAFAESVFLEPLGKAAIAEGVAALDGVGLEQWANADSAYDEASYIIKARFQCL